MKNTNSISRRQALSLIGGASIAGLAGCSGGSGGNSNDGVRAAFIYNTNIGDLGWTYAHEQGRKRVAEQFDWVETTYSESVAPADVERTLQQYTNNGFDVIYGCTFDYMDPMLSVASENPDTIYEHCAGYQTSENMGRYFGRVYQPRYLSGVAAARMTETGTLGFVGAFPITQVIRGINAFALGALSVDPDLDIEVRYVNSWYDPPAESQAAETLIESGADVITQHQNSPAPVRAASNADVWSIGFNAPMGEYGGEKYIASPIWGWDAFYAQSLQAVRDDNWSPNFDWGGLDEDYVALDDFGPNVPEDVASEVADVQTELANGDRSVWDGSKFEDSDDSFLFQDMATYVDGVSGSVPE
jgi:basic membrane protein A